MGSLIRHSSHWVLIDGIHDASVDRDINITLNTISHEINIVMFVITHANWSSTSGPGCASK